MAGALVLGQYLAGAIIGLMLSGGQALERDRLAHLGQVDVRLGDRDREGHNRVERTDLEVWID